MSSIVLCTSLAIAAAPVALRWRPSLTMPPGVAFATAFQSATRMFGYWVAFWRRTSLSLL